MNNDLFQLFVDLSQKVAVNTSFADYNFRTWQKDQFMDWHQHDFLQIIHVLEGELLVDYGNEWMNLRKGSLHILPPHKKHRLKTKTGHYQFGLNFKKAKKNSVLLSELLNEFSEPQTIKMRFKLNWKQALCEKNQYKNNWELLKIIHVLEDYCFNMLEFVNVSNQDPLACKLMKYIEKNLSKPVNVDKLAEKLNTSRSTLHRICKKSFGLGVSQLFEKARLEKVAERLITSGDSIESISVEIGFKDVAHLSNVFKKIYGVSPKDYRSTKF